MKVSGFTIIRNAVKFDYPIVEAIESILPVCDEVVVCVGESDDSTLELIQNIPSDKIRIVHSVWDFKLCKDLKVLAVETDKAFDAIAADSDWAFYIQGDEVIHEKYLPAIKQAMELYKDDKRVEGLLFNYEHFYGSYDYTGTSRRWYRHEIRIIRNDKSIRSYRDAQGFRKDGRKLNVKPVDAYVYHYGWVRPPKNMQVKVGDFDRLYAEATGVPQQQVPKEEAFDYKPIEMLTRFQGSHPAVMQPRIDRVNWTFETDPACKPKKITHRLLHFIEDLTGKRLFEYRNYKII